MLFGKRPPKRYTPIPLGTTPDLSVDPNIQLDRDRYGCRLDIGSNPLSVLDERNLLDTDIDQVEVKVKNNRVEVTVNEESMGVSIHHHKNWMKLEITHQFNYGYGLAEKHGTLNKFGQSWRFYNTDVANMESTDDPLYKNYPILVMGKPLTWIALIVDYPGYQQWDLEKSDLIEIHIKGDHASVDIIAANTPKELMKSLTTVLGKMELPPLWSLGYHQCRWSYFPADRVRQVADEFRTRNIPIDAIYLDIDYMDDFRCFTWDEEGFGNLPLLVRDLHDKDMKVVTMIDPGIKQDEKYFVYAEGIEEDHFTKKPNGDIYTAPVWPGKSAFPDYFHPATRDWWGKFYEKFVEYGIDGFWNDMNEPSTFTLRGTMPDDLLHSDGTRTHRHEEVHNLYGQMMAKASYEGLKKLRPNRRVFLLSRAGYLGSQRYGWIWSGDNRSDWEHLQFSIPKIINSGMSGHFASGPDIGGFREKPTPELYARWIQIGAFYPFMRTHYIKFVDEQEPWVFGQEVEDISRDMIKLRYRLMPYIYTYFREGCREGIPLMRPMFMEFPDDEHCYLNEVADSQFMFGPDILVAPVIEEGHRNKRVYFPNGNWYDFFGGEQYEGGQFKTVVAPLDTIPVYVREGSIIPIYKDVGKNMEETQQSGFDYVKFGDDASGKLYLDDGTSFDYQQHDYGLYTINNDLTLELQEGEGYLDSE